MMVLAQKRQTLPLWLLISIFFHILMLLIPLFPRGKGGDFSTVGEIELVEVGSPGSGSQVEIGGGGLAAPDAIALPQTQPPGAEITQSLAPSTVEVGAQQAPQLVQPGSDGGLASEQKQVATGKPAVGALDKPSTGSKPPGELTGPGEGSGESTTASGTSKGGTGAGGGGGDGGPSVPGDAKLIASTKALMNLRGNTISLYTIVELRPDGTYRVLEPIQEGSPATSAAKREFSRMDGELKNYAYHKPYRLKITFNYYPGKNQGQREFQVLD